MSWIFLAFAMGCFWVAHTASVRHFDRHMEELNKNLNSLREIKNGQTPLD